MSLEAAFSPQQHYVRFRITFPGKLLSTKRSRFVPPVDSPYSNTYTFKILPAQRLARKPLGRLCRHRFIILVLPSKNVPTKTLSRRPSRLHALVGRSYLFWK